MADQSKRPSLDDYIDVAERVVAFKDKYPDGSLQSVDWHVHEVAGTHFVVYEAAAYRAPDDQRPGHGTAWEPFPGTTPYTRNSELMNAETAAWGRAIVAVGLTSNRKLASRQEVEARMGEQNGDRPFGPEYDAEVMGKVTGAACVQLCGGDPLKGRALFKMVREDCGGYMPQAAALALIHAADTENIVPDVEAPTPQ